MTEAQQNPYRPPQDARSVAASEPTPPESETEPTTTVPLTSAGRRLTSTVICTGGILWCMISAAVFFETWMNPTADSNLKVSFLLGVIGAATFVLGMYMRHNKPRHTYLSFLVILLLLVLFPLVAASTEPTQNVFEPSSDLVDWTDV